IWNNTGTDWGTAASWTPISGAGTTFPGATDVALFVPLPAGAAAQQPNLASAQAALLLTLTPNPGLGGWTFTGDGQQLTLGGTGSTGLTTYGPAAYTFNGPVLAGA